MIHLSDLHLGKRVNEFPMLADQRFILAQILQIIDGDRPDGVLIAGDVYDKSVPPVEAVELFDDFLVKLAERKIPAFVIGGNHDSPERLAFCNRLIAASGIHISPAYTLITHQFVTGAARCDSEEISVGGTDNVDSSVFDGFDYVALGHIHGAQNVSSQRVRYCGTPLKYSFSEANQQKSVTVAELKEKGSLTVRTVPLVPLHEMREVRGTYEEIAARSFYENTSYPADYLHITLTDETDVPEAMAKLRIIYRNLMTISYDNARTRSRTNLGAATEAEKKTPLELFAEFYEKQNGAPMNEEQTAFVQKLIERDGEENVCDR